MSISNYSELVTACENWINRSDLTTQVPDFIRLAEMRIVGDLKIQHLMTSETITADNTIEAIATNYRGTVACYLNINPKMTLDYLPPDQFHLVYASSETGKPTAYTVMGNNLHLGPSPDSSYSLEHWYYASPDIATDTTNSLLTNYPNLYLFATVIEALDYTQDPLLARYEDKYARALDAAEEEVFQNGSMAIQLSDAP